MKKKSLETWQTCEDKMRHEKVSCIREKELYIYTFFFSFSFLFFYADMTSVKNEVLLLNVKKSLWEKKISINNKNYLMYMILTLKSKIFNKLV